MVTSEFSLDFDKIILFDTGKKGISINTTLKLSSNEISFQSHINTGSSFCIFERRFGEKLSLDIENGPFQNVGTATGVFRVYGFRLTLQVEDFQFDSLVYFAEDENFKRNVLGRHGFLELVKLGLINYEGKLYLSRYS